MGAHPLNLEIPRGLYSKKLFLLTVSAMSSFVFSAAHAQTVSAPASAPTAQPAPSKKARAATNTKGYYV